MIEKIKKYLTPSTLRKLQVGESKEASFHLVLDTLDVGLLTYMDGKWIFKYSEEFKESTGIKPLAGFLDINKTYISTELWPFFSSRIPSLSRDRVKKVIEEEGFEEKDLLALLKRFGKKTITNPFELLSSE